MRPGRLKDRVSIQAINSTDDIMGQPIQTWVETHKRNCSIEPLNGREYFSAEGEQQTQKVRVRFRYERGLLNTKKRLVDKRESPEVTYDIEDIIDPGNEHRELICICRRN